MSSDYLQTLEANIINNINSLKDEIISLKDMVIERLQEENERLLTNANNCKTEWLLLNLLLMSLRNTVREII